MLPLVWGKRRRPSTSPENREEHDYDLVDVHGRFGGRFQKALPFQKQRHSRLRSLSSQREIEKENKGFHDIKQHGYCQSSSALDVMCSLHGRLRAWLREAGRQLALLVWAGETRINSKTKNLTPQLGPNRRKSLLILTRTLCSAGSGASHHVKICSWDRSYEQHPVGFYPEV